MKRQTSGLPPGEFVETRQEGLGDHMHAGKTLEKEKKDDREQARQDVTAPISAAPRSLV